MQEGSQKPRHKLYGGIAASVALHVIIAVALFVRLPAAEMPPPQEESVSVEIVPPPEEQPAEEKPAEREQALNLTMPEQKPEEQPAPPPPPPPEPEQQPAEQAKAEPPPPPPPPAQQKQTEAEQSPPAEDPPPPPSEEQADEQQSPPAAAEPSPEDQQQNAEQQPANGRALPVLRPVFEFGQDATGSDVSPDGNASEAADEAKVEDTESPSENGEATEEPKTETPAEAAAPNLPQDVAPPSLETANADPLATSDDGTIEGILADIAAEPVEKPAEKQEPTEEKSTEDKKAEDKLAEDSAPAGKPMKEAKRLFSQRDTSDALATTAMGSLTRSARAKELCGTELAMQLRAANHWPDMLPSQGLAEGNILNIASAAFHEKGQWHDLGYRCEIDQNATKVVSFAIRVGEAIPRSQWKQRGLPTF